MPEITTPERRSGLRGAGRKKDWGKKECCSGDAARMGAL